MKKIIAFTFLCFLLEVTIVKSENKDSIRIKNIENKYEQLDNQVKEVRRDELNYQLEKDLLKETYSNNYERINLFLTVILGIFGLLSFLGIRDLNSIKKEYGEELDKLKKLQLDVDFKSKDFEESKKKYDKEIMEIIKQNEEQNNKLKIIEIKEKVTTLYAAKNYDRALEYCIVGLELAPNDIQFLLQKALIYTKAKKYDEVSPIYLRIIELEPKNATAILNLAEIYLFQNNEKSCDEIITKNSDYFNKKSEGGLFSFFDLIKLFNKPDIKKLKEKVVEEIDRSDLMNKKKRMEGVWDVTDALTYVHSRPESEQRKIFLNYIWYLDGQLNAKEALERLGIIVTEEPPAPKTK